MLISPLISSSADIFCVMSLPPSAKCQALSEKLSRLMRNCAIIHSPHYTWRHSDLDSNCCPSHGSELLKICINNELIRRSGFAGIVTTCSNFRNSVSFRRAS
ncbi:hypothetical protein CEXT_96261 [Caerostris extrusa]|uniref:Uncharacterized protein n=1 Tax=Caerostris extrusa TaxID=172846 RepID=A0AAV4P2K1_CAEEX|nr:hypothetical protein CEXT_96261 [Caerostris extrusa]